MTVKTITQFRRRTFDKANSSEDRVSLALEEYAMSLDAGEPLSREALLTKYGDVAVELRGCLDSLDFIREVAPQLMDAPANAAVDSFIPGSPNAPHPASSIPHPASIGLLGDFRILREIGRGGMGVVYEAEQLSIGRRVALKVLPFAAMLDKQQLNRFKNEARAAGTLDHPNIVAVHSVGCERGVHYYAMQLIEGRSLAEIIAAMKPGRPPSVEESALTADFNKHPATADTAKAALPTVHDRGSAAVSTIPPFGSREYFRTVAQLGIQAAEALDHAHQNGILHRDIKPANLLLDDTGKLWITDFGLARIEQDAGMTMTGDLLGTLRYMSPEQALAKRAVVDHRSDIYSLGVTLYELITHSAAFTGDDRQELLRQIAFEEPHKPRQINARIPQDLETIVLKAIEKNPADRYATAHEFANDLRRFTEDQPISARRPSPIKWLYRILRRHRAIAAVVGAATVIILIVVTAFLADQRRHLRDSNVFVEKSVDAARTALEANDVQQAMVRITEATSVIAAQPLVNRALVEQTQTLNKEIKRYGKFMSLLERASWDRDGSEASIAPAEEALSLYGAMDKPDWLASLRGADLPQAHVQRVADGAYTMLLLSANHLIRYAHGGKDKVAEAARVKSRCQDALKRLDTAAALRKPTRGYYWLMANYSFIIGDKEKEKRLRQTALETPPHDASELFNINRDYVRHHDLLGYPAGYPFEQSYKDHRDMLRLDPTYYNGLFFMGLRLGGADREAEALAAWYGCVAMRPDDWVAIMNRGETHRHLRHPDEALADFEAAVAKSASSVNHHYALGALADFLATTPDDRLRDGKRAVELATKACELTEYKEADVLDTLAAACAEAGDFDSAIKWGEKAAELAATAERRDIVKRLDNFKQHMPWRQD